MRPKFVGTLLFIIVIACFITGALVYPALPAHLISHWNATGHPNGVLGKFWGTFLLPFIMLFIIGVWALLPRIDPLDRHFKSFRYVYDFLWFLIVSFLAYVYALMLGINLGWQVNMLSAIMPALGILIFIIGFLLIKIKRNWFVGIRTPWTISSDTVWRKTHHLASILFKAAGVTIFLGGLIEPQFALWWIFAPIGVAVLVPVIYSYFVYRGEAVH